MTSDEPGPAEAQRKRVVAITVAVVGLVVLGGAVALGVLNSSRGTDQADGAAGTAATDVPASSAPGAGDPARSPGAGGTAATRQAPLAAPQVRPTPLPPTVNCAYLPDEESVKPVKAPGGTGVSARGSASLTMTTSVGAIGLTLDRGLAPCAVNSFLSLAKQGYFNGTACHRLTTARSLQVLQCGDPTGTGSGGPGYQFADEVFPQLRYGRGQIAMANAGPDTNGSQFFMIYGSANLPPNYTVFGTIAPAGLAVLDKVAQAGTTDSSDDGTPRTTVTISGANAG